MVTYLTTVMRNFFLIGIALLLTGCGCYEFTRTVNKIDRPTDFHGIVTRKYVDTFDRMTPKIRINYTGEHGIVAYEMFDELAVGDSVVKNSGSLEYFLYKNGKLYKSYYPKCDGQEIK